MTDGSPNTRKARAEALSNDVVQKARWIWTPRAAQLLRERRAVDFARSVIPAEVGGFRIKFPETKVSCGLKVVVRSQRLEGQSFLGLLYSSSSLNCVPQIALVVLEAFERADPLTDYFHGFSRLYRFVRRRQVILEEIAKRPLLTPMQRRRFIPLTGQYVRDASRQPQSLVHGDLSASNILVDDSRSMIGIIDLEMLHTGLPVTNFAQLWVAIFHRNPMLAHEFLTMYRDSRPETTDVCFDVNARAEISLRCYSDLRVARRIGNPTMERHAHFLLDEALKDQSLESICLQGVRHFYA